MGLPVAGLVIASNANDILPRAYSTGIYEMHGVVPTTSPSMDIQVSSNFERYLFEASDRDAALVRASMRSLARERRFDIASTIATMRDDFDAAAASEEEVAAAIRRVRAESGYLMDPHTACAFVALEKCLDQGQAPQVMLATAHPAKFPDAMQAIIGERPALPARLAGLLTAPERFTTIDNDLQAVERHVEELTRVACEGRG
jgi:threonine synthase